MASGTGTETSPLDDGGAEEIASFAFELGVLKKMRR